MAPWLIAVMAGLVPAIHVFACCNSKDVDARHKAGHDEIVSHDAMLFSIPVTIRLVRPCTLTASLRIFGNKQTFVSCFSFLLLANRSSCVGIRLVNDADITKLGCTIAAPRFIRLVSGNWGIRLWPGSPISSTCGLMLFHRKLFKCAIWIPLSKRPTWQTAVWSFIAGIFSPTLRRCSAAFQAFLELTQYH